MIGDRDTSHNEKSKHYLHAVKVVVVLGGGRGGGNRGLARAGDSGLVGGAHGVHQRVLRAARGVDGARRQAVGVCGACRTRRAEVSAWCEYKFAIEHIWRCNKSFLTMTKNKTQNKRTHRNPC